MTPEQQARKQIDAMLIASGWAVQDYKALDFTAGRGSAVREVLLTTGPCDYLLLVDRKALGVVEAKKEGTTLSAVADQSGRYASSLPDLLKHGLPRVAATLDMIATGTNISPIEVLIFLRDVRSRVYFEQMRGRGTRVVTPTDLQSVSGEDAPAKARIVIVLFDACNN